MDSVAVANSSIYKGIGTNVCGNLDLLTPHTTSHSLKLRLHPLLLHYFYCHYGNGTLINAPYRSRPHHPSISLLGGPPSASSSHHLLSPPLIIIIIIDILLS
jgi:hypothetical protein